MAYNNLKFGDFEVFPSFWCCALSNELTEEQYKSKMYHCQTDKEEELYIKSRSMVYCSLTDSECIAVKQAFYEKFGFNLLLSNDRDKFISELKTGVFSTYNGKGYDNKIANAIALKFTTRQVYLASQLIINRVSETDSTELGRIAQYVKWGWRGFESTQDFMDDSFKGLKDKESSYGLDIRETTVPFEKEELTLDDLVEIIYYNLHDVYALHVHYSSVARAYVDTKVQLCEIFGLDKKTAYSCTNAVLSGKVLEAKRVHGTSIKDPTITIRDEALDKYFKQYIPRDVYTHLLTSQKAKNFVIYDNEVSVADGGLHSILILPKIGKNKPAIYIESTSEYAMFNIDASSCYTSVMIYCDAISRSITNPQRLIEIYQRRMRLKVTPKSQWSKDDRYFVAAAKLVLNTTYGAMGNKYLALYDEYMRTKTCRVGQMVLIAIANSLFKNVPDLKVIQNNTDGVLVYTKRENKDLIQKLVDEFSEISHFIFEVEEDKLLWQLNVNNYIAIDPEDHMKDKGGSFVHDIHQPGYYHIRPLNSYCIPKAQIGYYRNKLNPVEALLNNNIVTDFCLTCTKGPGYYGMFHMLPSGEVELGKVARVVAVVDDTLGLVKKKKWAEIKTNAKQQREGVTGQMLIDDHTKKGSKIEIRDDIWKVHQVDTCALCPPQALVVNDALYNYSIKDGRLIHLSGKSWEIDYAYYARELDKALNGTDKEPVVWYKIKNAEVKITKEFNL